MGKIESLRALTPGTTVIMLQQLCALALSDVQSDCRPIAVVSMDSNLIALNFSIAYGFGKV